MNITVLLLFFSFVFSLSSNWEREREREREREWVYKIGYKEKRSQSLLIFFFRRSSCGEYFLFYGLIDFMLFLVLAWRNGSFVIYFFVFFYPEYLALVPSATNPVQQVTFLLSISADGKESPLPFWGPSQSFGFSLLPPWPGDPLGLLYVTPYPFLFPSGHQVQTSVFPFWLGFVTLGLTHIPMMS